MENQTIPLIGKQLGSYEIVALLGRGGMGEVYRARDQKLRREVALKVLPTELAADAGRMGRFEREARMLAALNHPNIAAIYGLEEWQGKQVLVMELVEGVTLAERLTKGPLKLEETQRIALQMAEALEAAHEKRIVHRDLKPANVKVTPEGKVKVLDFGLAKAWAGEGVGVDLSEAATVTASWTETGMIIGTPAYMSPEQARGTALDKRTDLWSFGCVLYEALAGRRAFAGRTLSDSIAAVLTKEPDWEALPASTSPNLRKLLRRCLEKDLQKRLRDAGDVRLELEDLLAAPAQEVARPSSVMTRRTVISGISGVVVGAVASGVFAIRRSGGAPRHLTRFSIATPDAEPLPVSFNRRVAISPDGTWIAFNTAVPGGSSHFYLRSLNELEPRRVKDVPGAGAFFSPDGLWVGFLHLQSGLGIRKLALSGGAPATICHTDQFIGATWGDDDNVYFVADFPSGLMGVPAAGGEPKEVVKIDFDKGERLHRYPYAPPGSQAVLFTMATADIGTFDEARIVGFSLANKKKKVLAEGGTHPRYSPSGHLLYAHDGKILAVRFDAKNLETMGQPFPVLEGVQMSRNNGLANYDVSASGDLIYIPGICEGGVRTLVWVDRSGKPEPVPLPAQSYLHPRLSPDDRRLAIEVEGANHDLYVYDFERAVLAKMTSDGVSHWPVWSPDGKQLAYRSGPMSKFRMWRVPADRSREPEQVPATGTSQSAESWSPDGRAIAYIAQQSLGVPPSIMVAAVDGSHPAQPFAGGKAPQGSSKFSPDGRWLAYCSNESGKPQVYVQAFPGPGPKIQISSDGGTDPVWKRAGGELYYRNGDSVMVVAVTTSPAFTAGRPQELWKGHYSHGMSTSCGAPGATSSNYDVTANGKRFLMIKDDDQDRTVSKQIVVVLGWASEVSRLAAKS